MRAIFYLLFVILLSSLSGAATISGNVYDFSLDRVNNAVVTINTEPVQQMVSENASYRFEVGAGSYTIKAVQLENGRTVAEAEENITIKQEGTFRRDIILFPSFADEEELLDLGFAESTALYEQGIPGVLWIGLAAIVAGAGVLIGSRMAKKAHKRTGTEKTVKADKKLPGDLKDIVDFIAAEGGRTTQKDIRKKFPLSEAKISLMVADLEQRGVVKKVKKGRGNVVILQ